MFSSKSEEIMMIQVVFNFFLEFLKTKESPLNLKILKISEEPIVESSQTAADHCRSCFQAIQFKEISHEFLQL